MSKALALRNVKKHKALREQQRYASEQASWAGMTLTSRGYDTQPGGVTWLPSGTSWADAKKWLGIS